MWGYPLWGYWYHPGWGWWYYPWVGGWYYPGYWGWYYPTFGFSVLLQTEKQERPYVIVANKKSPETTWFAVYEQKEGTKEDALFEQTEAPRAIEKGKNLRIYLEGRTENEVIVFSNNQDDLKTKLTSAEIEKLSALELGNIDVVKGKKDRGQLSTEADTSRATSKKVDKFYKEVGKRKKDFGAMEEKAKRVDLQTYIDKKKSDEIPEK
jgi:hypothetical protein